MEIIDTGQLFAIIGEYEVRCRIAAAQLAELEARIGKLETEVNEAGELNKPLSFDPGPQPPPTPGSGWPTANPWNSLRHTEPPLREQRGPQVHLGQDAG